MSPELKTQWLQALRSGNYEQGTAYLANYSQGKTKFCCLGVLCEVAGVQRIKNEDKKVFEYGNLRAHSLFYWDLLSHFGLTEEQQKHLAKLNDGVRHNFPQIADYIERHI